MAQRKRQGSGGLLALENLQSNETLVAAIRASSGDRCALMEKLYNNNVGMISKMANDAACGENLFDDLMQEGYIALENAVKCFDEGHGAQFVTYLGAALKWHFRGFQRSAALPVSVPAYLCERLAAYKATKAALEQEQAADVKPAQVAAAMGLDAKQAAEVELLLYQLRTVRLDEPIDETGETTAGDLIPDGCDVAGEVCDDAEREYNRRLLDDALQRDLDETARQVVLRYYGGEQLRDVADDMGLQYQQVVNVNSKAIRALRRDMQLRVDYYRSCDLYQYSFNRFKDSGLSSVEFIAERNEMLLDKASKTSV